MKPLLKKTRTVVQPRPKKLQKKLRVIREHFRMSQEEILDIVCPWFDKGSRAVISAYEVGSREPGLITLLLYSRMSGVNLEELIDDNITITSVNLILRQQDKVDDLDED